MSTEKQISSLNDNSTISIPELRTIFNERLIAPGDPGYDQARTVFYGGIDRHPAAILRPSDASDVSRIIALARQTGLELAVRSGGHSSAGHGVTEGGIVLDLSNMKSLQIDPDKRSAWAGSGLTAAEYSKAADIHNLVTGFGDTGSVGLGGLTLGGGVGYLVRKHGLTIDDLLAAEVVTADGRILTVDAGSQPDLFWAIRGGGGNFGVVTRFQFRLHELGSVIGGMLILPATADVITAFLFEADHAPEQLSTIANVMIAPPMPFLPPAVHGKPILMVTLVYSGETGSGERVLAPFRKLATPLADMLRPMRYPEIYPPDEANNHPMGVGHTMFVDALDRDQATTILENLKASTAAMAVAQLRVLGGAVARVPVQDTAYAHRKSRIMVNLAALYQKPEEKPLHTAWGKNFASSLHSGDSGAYVNFLGDEGELRVHAAYPGATWGRLAKIKAQYDPDNLFHLNQNIAPIDNRDPRST